MQGLARLPTFIPSLQNLQWHRQSSILSFHFHAESLAPSQVFDFLKKLKLAPRWKKRSEKSESVKTERTRFARLGLTGALLGNLMIFSVPIYAGLSGRYQNIFEWIQFGLFMPVLFWCAIPFYKTALSSLRLRQLSLDLPLTVAFLTGSFFSILSLLKGEHEIYFDSLTGFLFLILWSRYFLENSLTKYLKSPGFDHFFENPFFNVIRNRAHLTLTWDEIQKDDLLTIKAGDRIPADGILQSRSATIETAWLTGELSPHLRLAGSSIDAGTLLLSREASLLVTIPTKETRFARLLESLGEKTEKLQSSIEAKIGTGLVLTCALAILILLFQGDTLGLNEILRRSIALLIVACPCAISFAAPMARAKASQLATKKGFWIRDSFVWDRLLKTKKMAFDKTGTLTGGQFSISSHSPMIDVHWKKIILSLENISSHPIAESLRRMWGDLELHQVENAKETLGIGVEGKINNSFYQLKTSSSESHDLVLELIQDGHLVFDLVLEESILSDIQGVLKKWGKKTELYLVSGDSSQRVSQFATRFGFKPENSWGNLKPQDKLAKIEQISPDIYFGDGTNDLLALKKAPISVAVAKSCLEAQAAADILMIHTDLKSFDILFEIAKATRSLNLRNFALALVYNFGAGVAALAGWISPFEAAVLMPISSFALFASTMWANRKFRKLEK